MVARSIILAALLCTCQGGCQAPAPELPSGFQIDAAPYTRAEVDGTVAQIVELLDAMYFDGFQERLNTDLVVSIDFWEGAIPCGDGDYFGCTRGWEYERRVQVTAEYQIVGCTSLMHELLHVADNGKDKDHESDFWYAHGREASIEGRVYDIVCNERIRAGESLHWGE